MLVLTRKVGERICIGEEVTVTVVRLSSGSVGIGVEAPRDWNVCRKGPDDLRQTPSRPSRPKEGCA